MKIGLIAPTTIPSRSANTIQVMKNAVALTKVGHEVRLYIPKDEDEVPWNRLASQYGLVTEQPEHLELVWVTRKPFWRTYDYGVKAFRAAKRDGVDCVFTRLLQSTVMASLARMPIYFELHDLPAGKMGPVLFRQFLRGRGEKTIVTITQALMDAIEADYRVPSKVRKVVAPDGVDLGRFENLPTQEEVRDLLGIPHAFTVGYTGHLYRGRGEEILLSLAKRMREANFLIIGGREKDIERVQNVIDTQGLKNIHLVGFIPNTVLPQYQRACDCLLMPYQKEIAGSSGGDIAKFLSPMKMFEYLASGKPILSSDLPVLREVLNEKNSILLPCDDLDAWEEAILKVKNEEAFAIKLALAAKETAKNFSWQQRVKSIFGEVEK
jgi:glycosyltransferase involved in cell wall biosynthesis